jgi:hypothetical protein
LSGFVLEDRFGLRPLVELATPWAAHRVAVLETDSRIVPLSLLELDAREDKPAKLWAADHYSTHVTLLAAPLKHGAVHRSGASTGLFSSMM